MSQATQSVVEDTKEAKLDADKGKGLAPETKSSSTITPQHETVDEDWQLVTEEDGKPPEFHGTVVTSDGSITIGRGKWKKTLFSYHAGYSNGHPHWSDEETEPQDGKDGKGEKTSPGDQQKKPEHPDKNEGDLRETKV
ncbi:hypothetical protein NM208_g11366 [Fusarium decemcellulare]|uniref:Uncharacterized protein n=1 Tax=Fusarium decemcellulare TaxID=57161 RepID=A0ACC1RUA9_9HYPO|nr:hypothetical protein NM208_g11366 [Fusarium decemcellulare]